MKCSSDINKDPKIFNIAINQTLRFHKFEPSLISLTDKELAAKAAAGSEDHFEALVRRYSNAMYRVAFRLCGNRSEAEDIVQETFIKLFRALPKARLDLPFKPWLYKIAVNASFSRLRKRKEITGQEMNDAKVDLRDTADQAADKIDLQTAVGRLPLDYRQVIVLRAVEDLTFAEIAQILDIPQATARTWFKRAKDALRQTMGT